jgi:hypothetical protein
MTISKENAKDFIKNLWIKADLNDGYVEVDIDDINYLKDYIDNSELKEIMTISKEEALKKIKDLEAFFGGELEIEFFGFKQLKEYIENSEVKK